MITIKTSKVSNNVGLNEEDIQVKSVSAAWNEIRKIRDTTDPKILDGTILSIEGDLTDKIPNTIIFKMNVKGKIQFHNYNKSKHESVIEKIIKVNAEVEEMKNEPGNEYLEDEIAFNVID